MRMSAQGSLPPTQDGLHSHFSFAQDSSASNTIIDSGRHLIERVREREQNELQFLYD